MNPKIGEPIMESLKEGLKFLFNTITFLQQKSVFTLSNTPELNPAIEKISVKAVNCTTQDIHDTCVALGTRYLPSVMYEIQVLYKPGRCPPV